MKKISFIKKIKFPIWKMVVIAVVVIGFVGFLTMSYWFKAKDEALAQNFVSGQTQVRCEEPIPIGNTIDATVDFVDKIYQAYQGNEMQTAAKQVADLAAVLAGNGKVCDFGKCRANVATAGPDLKLRGQALPGTKAVEYKYTIGSCKIAECTGNPCPDLTQYLKGKSDQSSLSLDALANALESQADNINILFSGKAAVIPAGLEQEGERPGDNISDADLVRRYISSVEKDWLTPNPFGNNCVPSELERQRIAQGTMGEKYPLTCAEALSKDLYTPKAWSETCQKQCQTFSQECKDCLARCEGKSVFATLNCKIYSMGRVPSAGISKCSECKNKDTGKCAKSDCLSGAWGSDCQFAKQFSISLEETCYQKAEVGVGENDKCAFIKGQSKKCCGSVCADGFNADCRACLCAGEKPGEVLSPELCLDWICGGSRSNWVCCHEEPITNPLIYATNDYKTEADAIGATNGGSVKTKTSVYIDNINKTSSGLSVEMGVIAATSRMPFGTCVKIIKVGEGEKGPSAIYDPRVYSFSGSYIETNSAGEKQNEYFCVTDRGGKYIESGQRLDIWLDKNREYYTSRKLVTGSGSVEFWQQWGVRNTDVWYWYNPANSCLKKGKLDLNSCKESEITEGSVEEGVSLADLTLAYMKFNSGIDKQWDDASKPLKELLLCVDGKVTKNFRLSSISDSAGIDFCGNARTFIDDACGHTSPSSCHYGGLQDRKYKEWVFSLSLRKLKSLAADISIARSQAGGAEEAAKAVCTCGAELGVQVTSIKEADHYHVSVEGDGYDCDKSFRISETPKGNNVCN